jgi:hypothetical protein
MPTTVVHGHTIPLYGAVGEVEWRAIERLALSTYKPKVIANTTARAQYIADLAALDNPIIPSTSNPVSVFRTDADAGAEFEYTVDGSTWRALLASMPWADLTLSAASPTYTAVAGYGAQYRVQDGWAEFKGLVQAAADVPTSASLLTGVGAAPAAVGSSTTFGHVAGGANSSGLYAGTVFLNPRSDGAIRTYASGAGIRYFALDGFRYRVA